jgi:nitrogenase-associated protein
MTLIHFYEKPGCRNNARQKALLQASGHHVETHDLLKEPWTAGRLRAYFGQMPVSAWFNRAAPKIKEGIVIPEEHDEASAITLMLADPLLIRRPLMEIDGHKAAGFNVDQLKEWINLDGQDAPLSEACARTDGKSCP